MHKILVVDDEVAITTHLEERLAWMGYEVVGRASSGKESINIAKRHKPDLILMDIVMPGKLNGIDAAEKIKKELDIPIVFLTAYADDKFIKRAKNVEPFGYLVKPVNPDEIKATIEVALHKKDIESKLHELVEKYHTIQIIYNLLNLQTEYIKNEKDLIGFKERMDRVRSICLIQEKFYQVKDLPRIDFTNFIRNLVTRLFHSYRVNKNLIKLNINVDEVLLNMKTAIPCGLITSELVSNSLKYAFPKGKKGEIYIGFHLDKENIYTLVVKDNGIGFPKDLDFRKTRSCGFQIVNELTSLLKGTIGLDRRGGTTFKISFEKRKHKKEE